MVGTASQFPTLHGIESDVGWTTFTCPPAFMADHHGMTTVDALCPQTTCQCRFAPLNRPVLQHSRIAKYLPKQRVGEAKIHGEMVIRRARLDNAGMPQGQPFGDGQ